MKEEIPSWPEREGEQGEVFTWSDSCLASHQPQLESTGWVAGLILPGWLRSDITGSHHLLTLESDQGDGTEALGGGGEGGQSARALTKETTSCLATELWGAPAGSKQGSAGHPGSALGPPLRWEGARARRARAAFLFPMDWSGARSMFYFSFC